MAYVLHYHIYIYNFRIESCGIRGDFYKEDKTIAEYLKKKVRKILLEPAILEVFDDNVFGFDFSTKGEKIMGMSTVTRILDPKNCLKRVNGAPAD